MVNYYDRIMPARGRTYKHIRYHNGSRYNRNTLWLRDLVKQTSRGIKTAWRGTLKLQIQQFNEKLFTPARMAPRPCHQLEKVTESRRPEQYPKYCPKPTVASNYINGVIQQKKNRIEVSQNQSIDRAPVIAVNSRCQGVDKCSAQVRAYSV